MCDERLASRWEGVEEVEDEGAEVGEADGMATDYKGNVNEESHDKNFLKEFTDEIYYLILYSEWHATGIAILRPLRVFISPVGTRARTEDVGSHVLSIL